MGFLLFLPSDVVYALPERCLAVPDPVPHGLTQHHTLLAPGRASGAFGKRTGAIGIVAWLSCWSASWLRSGQAWALSRPKTR